MVQIRMNAYDDLKIRIQSSPHKWLVTGAAGFIGSHLTQALLALGQTVVGMDDLSSGRRENLDVLSSDNFTFIEGDIRERADVGKACEGVGYILHHAAIGSVVKSIEDPELVNGVNVGGFQNILYAAKRAGVKRVVYASSSAIYGDGDDQPRKENDDISPKSPYAQGKILNEFDAASAEVETVGLRYFNIYGARQDPNGAYAAVIPRWVEQMHAGQPIEIYGDGETVRDFCHVDDVVQANILAALSDNKDVVDGVFNIGSGQATTLNDLFFTIKKLSSADNDQVYKDFREGDIKVSQADILKVQDVLGFEVSCALEEGLKKVIDD